MRPVRAISRAAMTGPIPGVAISVLPECLDMRAQCLGIRRQLCVQGAKFGYEVFGQLLAYLLDRPGRSDPAEHRRRGGGCELKRCATGQQVAQHRVQLVDRAHPRLGQIHPLPIEQGKHRSVALSCHLAGLALQRGDGRGRGGVDRVALAAAAARELPNAGGGGGVHVHDTLAASQKPLREMASQAGGTLHSPTSLRPPPGPGQQPAVLRQRGLDTDRGDRPVAHRLHRCGGVGRLVRVETEQDHREIPLG